MKQSLLLLSGITIGFVMAYSVTPHQTVAQLSATPLPFVQDAQSIVHSDNTQQPQRHDSIAWVSPPKTAKAKQSSAAYVSDSPNSVRDHFDHLLPVEEQAFTTAVKQISPTTANVLDDLAIAYSAKCNETPTWAHLKALTHTDAFAFLSAYQTAAGNQLVTSDGDGLTDEGDRQRRSMLKKLYQAFTDLDCVAIEQQLPKDLCIYEGNVIELGKTIELESEQGRVLAECILNTELHASLYLF